MPAFKRGFTLVELLVVVVVIATIASIGIPTLNSITTRGRDTQRLSDLKKIQSSIEQYYLDQQFYPQTISSGQAISSPQGSKSYLATVPKDPKTGADYLYQAVPGGCNNGGGDPVVYCTSYCLYSNVEGISSGLAEGCTVSGYNLALSPTFGTSALSGADPTPTRPPTPTPTPSPTLIPTPASTPFPTSGLTAYWKLDEASGNRVAYVGSSLAVANTVFSAAGKQNNAVRLLPGYDGFLTTPDSNAVSGDGSTQSRTYAAWVKAESFTPPQNMILSKYYTGNKEMILYWAGNNRFRLLASPDLGNEYWVDANSLGPPAPNTWYFVVGWFDHNAGTLNIQVNNGVVNSIPYNLGIANGTRELAVGALNGGNYFWHGLIDEVGIWNRVLTASERVALYNGGAGRQP